MRFFACFSEEEFEKYKQWQMVPEICELMINTVHGGVATVKHDGTILFTSQYFSLHKPQIYHLTIIDCIDITTKPEKTYQDSFVTKPFYKIYVSELGCNRWISNKFLAEGTYCIHLLP